MPSSERNDTWDLVKRQEFAKPSYILLSGEVVKV